MRWSSCRQLAGRSQNGEVLRMGQASLDHSRARGFVSRWPSASLGARAGFAGQGAGASAGGRRQKRCVGGISKIDPRGVGSRLDPVIHNPEKDSLASGASTIDEALSGEVRPANSHPPCVPTGSFSTRLATKTSVSKKKGSCKHRERSKGDSIRFLDFEGSSWPTIR